MNVAAVGTSRNLNTKSVHLFHSNTKNQFHSKCRMHMALRAAYLQTFGDEANAEFEKFQKIL